MKLLHITASPFNNEGGVPVVLMELVREQVKLPNMAVKVLSLKTPINSQFNDHFEYLGNKSFKKFVEDFIPDVAIFHSFFYPEYTVPAIILHKLKIPFFIEPHGSFGHAAMKKGFFKKYIANHTIFRNQLKYAESFIFLNQRERVDSVYHKDGEMIIPNGINKIRVKTAICELNETPLLYYIGRYDYHDKGIDRLFDAIKLLDDCGKQYRINFYGKGPQKDFLQIQRRISELRNMHVVEKGPITKDEQIHELEQKGILLLASRHEGFPMTVLEALSFGNPCVLTIGTNMAEELEKNTIGWMVGDAPQDIADGIVAAVNSYKKDRSNYIKRCKQYVLKNYTWDVIAKKSYRLLNEKIGNK